MDALKAKMKEEQMKIDLNSMREALKKYCQSKGKENKTPHLKTKPLEVNLVKGVNDLTLRSKPKKSKKKKKKQKKRGEKMFLVTNYAWLSIKQVGYDNFHHLEKYWESKDPEKYPNMHPTLPVNKKQETVYYCQECDAESGSWDEHKEHVAVHKKHHQLEELTCKVCSKTFQWEDEFELHQKVHVKRSVNASACQCRFCDKVYTRADTLRRHERTCQLRGFARSNGVEHKDVDEYIYKVEYSSRFNCSFCAKTYSGRYRAREHVLAEHFSEIMI